MQQTETYKLNLIDKNDTFSPDPLNDNTQKLEAQLNAVRAEAAGADDALSGRITTLEDHRIAAGTYIGSGGYNQTIELGFRPKFVIMQLPKNTSYCWGAGEAGGSAKLADNGFTLTTSDHPNLQGNVYIYLAIR